MKTVDNATTEKYLNAKRKTTKVIYQLKCEAERNRFIEVMLVDYLVDQEDETYD